MKKYLSNSIFLILGVVIGIWLLPAVLESNLKTQGDNAFRTPEMKVDLSSGAGESQLLIWKSYIPVTPKGKTGLEMHRHNYSRLLIPLTPGTLQRKDVDGSTTDYVLEVGKPLFLSADTPEGLHTDDNFTNEPIEVLVLQFNQSTPILYDKLTEDELGIAISLN